MLLLLSLKFHFVSCTRLDKAFFQLLLLFCSVFVSAFCYCYCCCYGWSSNSCRSFDDAAFRFFFVVHAAALRFCYESCRSIALLVANYNFPIVCVCPSENLHKHQFVFECVHEFLYQIVFYDFQFFRSSPDSTGLTACTSGWVCVSVWDPHSSIPTNSHIVDME